MEIITNYHWRNFLYGYELPESALADFDWLDNAESESFIFYRGNYYHLSEFMVVNKYGIPIVDGQPVSFLDWHGYFADSFFSGVLIRVSDDGEQYQVATYIN